jgi:hypothetical protein
MVIDAMTQIGVEQYRDAVEKNSWYMI